MQDTLYLIAGSWSGRLAILARPRGGDWLEGEVQNWAHLGLDLVVSLLEPNEVADFDLEEEEKFCRSNGIQFMSLPVPDWGIPGSHDTVLKLVSRLDRDLADGKTVGIHCRQGIGRSGLLAACLLVSIGLSPQTAFERLSEARGRPVPETIEQRQWVEGFAPELVEFGTTHKS